MQMDQDYRSRKQGKQTKKQNLPKAQYTIKEKVDCKSRKQYSNNKVEYT